MASGKSLSDQDNERVRDGIRELLRLHDDNQTKIQGMVGLTQSAISAFLGGRQGTSFRVAARVAQLLKRPLKDFVSGVPDEEQPTDLPPVPGERPDDPPAVTAMRRTAHAQGMPREYIAQLDFFPEHYKHEPTFEQVMRWFLRRIDDLKDGLDPSVAEAERRRARLEAHEAQRIRVPTAEVEKEIAERAPAVQPKVRAKKKSATTQR